MSFSQLPRELQLEILEYVSPPSWPSAFSQFVELAEKDFNRPGSKYDVWGSFVVYDTEHRRDMNEVAKGWSLYISVSVDDLKGDRTYHLKVFAVCSYGEEAHEDTLDWDPCKLDLTVSFEKVWTDRETFLEQASDLLQFVPRQILRLPKLSCSVFAVKYDKCAYFVNLPGSPYEHLKVFPETRGAACLLSQLC